jgi:hypothetical protein
MTGVAVARAAAAVAVAGSGVAVAGGITPVVGENVGTGVAPGGRVAVARRVGVSLGTVAVTAAHDAGADDNTRSAIRPSSTGKTAPESRLPGCGWFRSGNGILADIGYLE